MTAPNMATITESLERSLQNCSLNHHQHHRASGVLGGGEGEEVVERSSSSDEAEGQGAEQNQQLPNNSDTALELNSHLSLPYHWEQCLDLTTGEIYYINWRNGMKAREDPRIASSAHQEYTSGDFCSEEEEDESSYDSEESSSESSPPSSSSRQHHRQRVVVENEDHVLVVAGCKRCLMYVMVPKRVQDCPRCNGQLLHFDRSFNGSP